LASIKSCANYSEFGKETKITKKKRRRRKANKKEGGGKEGKTLGFLIAFLGLSCRVLLELI